MKARKGLKWLACALVGAASMVLLGCPHNNVIEHDVVSGSGATTGRGGNGGVKLVITNFTDGSQNDGKRTIVADHIDIKADTSKYVFVAEGTGSGTFGPEFISVDASGIASLNISGGGVWEITVYAYEVAKLSGQPTIQGTDNATIVAQDTPQEVKAIDTALVLQGKATVDLSGGKQVSLTLTGDNVGTQGDVNVEIYFDTPNDVDMIRDNNYDVTIALYNYVTGEQVPTTENKLITGGQAPANPDTYNAPNVPKGRYQFRLQVSDPAAADKILAYYVDDIYVEGNRTTNGEVRITNLFNAPTDPTALKVYYRKKADSDLKDGYIAEFKWGGVSYNAVGIDMEIADVTKWYKYDGGQHKVNFGDGDVPINNNDDLWNKIDTLAGGATAAKADVVTTLSWEDSPQSATAYPAIYKSGSLLSGSDGIEFVMQAGHVYSVRIKAAGAQTDSGWYIFGDTMTAPGSVGTGTEFTALTTQGLFDLIEVTYDLEGKYLLYKTAAGPAIGTKAVADDLVLYHEYNPGAGYMVDKKYTVNMQTTNENDWFLYPQTVLGLPPAQVSDRIMTWTGWQNKNDSQDTYLITNNWNAAGYTGYKNLHLIPVGAGASATVKAETSGTFDVLDNTKVLISLESDDTPTGATATWAELRNGDTNPVGGGADVKNAGLGLQADGTRYILNLNKGGGTPTVLYVTVGNTATAGDIGKLTDKNSADFTVKDIQVSLKQGISDRVTFSVKPDEPVAYYKMDGVASGDYTLYLNILTSSGYWQTYQVPFVVKYDTQVIQ